MPSQTPRRDVWDSRLNRTAAMAQVGVPTVKGSKHKGLKRGLRGLLNIGQEMKKRRDRIEEYGLE